MNIIADCTHNVTQDGVHEFIFHKATRPAVDFLMDEVAEILRSTPLDQSLMITVDVEESGVPPLRYAMTRSRTLTTAYFNDNPGEKQQHQLYLVLVSTNALIQTFKIFVEQFARGRTRIRITGTREEGHEWLVGMKAGEAQ